MPFDWSPDGKSLAVEVQRKDRTVQLGVVSVPDGSFHLLKSLDWQGPDRMFFSPDGRWLGYDLPNNSARTERDILVMAVDGSRELLLVEHRGQNQMAGWSPDGKWLLFSSDRTGSTDLWAIPFSDGRLQGSPQLLKTGFEGSWSLGMTASGTLYYSQTKGGSPSKIQIASLDKAGNITAPELELSLHYLDSDKNPTWSPDGKRLAYLSERGPRGAKTYVPVIRTIETGQVRELREVD
jgi:Tol biopolymer transport system component